jgi:hypothetical protein
MTIPRCWLEHGTTFKETLSKANSKQEADTYVYKCLIYFIEFGYSEPDIHESEILMKKAVKDWAKTKFPVLNSADQAKTDPPKTEIGLDIRKVLIFDPNRTYIFKSSGTHAQRLQQRLTKYEADLLKKRKNPQEENSRHKELISLVVVDSVLNG